MPKKETLMCMARCKRKDGKIADYYVHRMGGGVVIIGPNLERYRCHPGVTNAEAARIEIASVCIRSSVKELLGKQIDALARRFAVSQDARVGEEIERLATEYGKLGKPWVFVGRPGSRLTSAQ